MLRKFTSILLFLCAILLCCSDAYSELTQARDISISSRDAMSAWTQEKGHSYRGELHDCWLVDLSSTREI